MSQEFLDWFCLHFSTGDFETDSAFESHKAMAWYGFVAGIELVRSNLEKQNEKTKQEITKLEKYVSNHAD